MKNYGEEEIRKGKTCKGCEDAEWRLEVDCCEELLHKDTNATGIDFQIRFIPGQDGKD